MCSSQPKKEAGGRIFQRAINSIFQTGHQKTNVPSNVRQNNHSVNSIAAYVKNEAKHCEDNCEEGSVHSCTQHYKKKLLRRHLSEESDSEVSKDITTSIPANSVDERLVSPFEVPHNSTMCHVPCQNINDCDVYNSAAILKTEPSDVCQDDYSLPLQHPGEKSSASHRSLDDEYSLCNVDYSVHKPHYLQHSYDGLIHLQRNKIEFPTRTFYNSDWEFSSTLENYSPMSRHSSINGNESFYGHLYSSESNTRLNSNSSKDDSTRRKSFPTTKPRACIASPTLPRVNNEIKIRSEENISFRTCMPLPNYGSYLDKVTPQMGFYDSHCHLDFLFGKQNYEDSLASYLKQNTDSCPVSYLGCIAVFCNPTTFKKTCMWKKYLDEENVWGSFGCHPNFSLQYDEIVEEELCKALEHPSVRALGEIGLDYSKRNAGTTSHQQMIFKRQLQLAMDRKLPIVLHCRDAYEDCLMILKEMVPKNHFIHLHCFTDTWESASKFLKEYPNLFLGITNLVTYSSAECVHNVAKNIPLDRLLLETDAPYFVPRLCPRGVKYSHPGLAVHVAAQIAALKRVPIAHVLENTKVNTRKMYRI